jgi:hypothetical protein
MRPATNVSGLLGDSERERCQTTHHTKNATHINPLVFGGIATPRLYGKVAYETLGDGARDRRAIMLAR